MDLRPNKRRRRAKTTPRARRLPAGTEEHQVPVTLQDVAAMPGLGALIMEFVPLPDRVRIRKLCSAFKASVDASLHTLQRIRAADLEGLDKRSNGDMEMWLASKCPNLRVLELLQGPTVCSAQEWWNHPVADSVVIHLATHCWRLQILSLYSCEGVSDSALRALAASCGKLQSLDIGDCGPVTDAGVSAIAAGCRQLRYLFAGPNVNLSDASMLAIAAHCPHLRHLDVVSTSVTDAGIIAIARACPDLRSLHLMGCKDVGDGSAAAVAENCRLLESLEYDGTDVGDEGIMAVMRECTRLKELRLHVSDDRVWRLGPDSCRQLHSLTIVSGYIEDGVVAAVCMLAPFCTNLARLELEGPVAMDAVVAAFAANCPHLEAVFLDSGAVTDAGVLALTKKCPRLRMLGVCGGEGVTNACLVELAQRCPDLKVLK